MSDDPMRQMIQGMLDNLEREGVEMNGVTLDDLKDAMAQPGAAEFLADWMPIDAASVQPGADAPDFCLPFLPGHAVEGEALTLSSHFGERPVALIFGSYT